jgi:hypothetical protein
MAVSLQIEITSLFHQLSVCEGIVNLLSESPLQSKLKCLEDIMYVSY